MVPADKEELRKLVTDATMETYEDLSYHKISLLYQKWNPKN